MADDFAGRVGVDRDNRTIGVDFPPDPRITFSRTWARAVVTQGYIAILAALAGRPIDAEFYKWDAGEVILLRANGSYTQGEGWSITAEFGVEENEVNIQICAGLVVPAKKGWEYLWVLEKERQDPNTGAIVTQPDAAYVEELLRPANFALLEIGA